MATTRADDAGGSATATADLDPNSAWGDGDAATAANDFDPISDWDGGDEVTAASALTATDDTTPRDPLRTLTGAKRKRGHCKHAARDARKLQRWRPRAVRGSAPGTDTGSGVRQSDNT